MDTDKQLIPPTGPDYKPASTIDQKIIDQAKTKNSPFQRLCFFEDFCTQELKDVPIMFDPDKPPSQSEGVMLELAGIKAAYRQLFAREISDDVPEVEDQFKELVKRYPNGMVPENSLGLMVLLCWFFKRDVFSYRLKFVCS